MKRESDVVEGPGASLYLTMGSKGVSAVLSADGVIALDIDALVPGGLGAWRPGCLDHLLPSIQGHFGLVCSTRQLQLHNAILDYMNS